MARLLLVDDAPAMLFALKELAESSKHEAVLAPSGAEALALVDGVDAVVTDYAMSAMDGVQLLKSIRDRDESIPVMLLTAHESAPVGGKGPGQEHRRRFGAHAASARCSFACCAARHHGLDPRPHRDREGA